MGFLVFCHANGFTRRGAPAQPLTDKPPPSAAASWIRLPVPVTAVEQQAL
jgi:hypothetical protein